MSLREKNVIDDAKVHFLRGFSVQLPLEQAYLHVGVFLGWVIERQLYSWEFLEEGETQMRRFMSEDISCIILGELWDGMVTYDQLNNEGKAFAKYYYASGMYFEDYAQALASKKQSMYQVADTRANYCKMREVLDQRFQAWKKRQET